MRLRSVHALIVLTGLIWLVSLASAIGAGLRELRCSHACAGWSQLAWMIGIPLGAVAALAVVGLLYGQYRVRSVGVVALCVTMLLGGAIFLVGSASIV